MGMAAKGFSRHNRHPCFLQEILGHVLRRAYQSGRPLPSKHSANIGKGIEGSTGQAAELPNQVVNNPIV